MTQTIQARNVNIRDLIEQFGLQLVQEDQFFWEWQQDLPDITPSEREFLDKVKAGYLNLVTDPPFLEKPVQIAILSPMLHLGDFFLPPFRLRAEHSIEISAEDKGTVIRGQLDILLMKEQFWVMAIESKRFSFSTEAGLAQLLSYMLANLHPTKPGFGMIVTGGTFVFVKLVKDTVSKCAVSDEFATRNRGNDLYEVFRILKRFGQL